MVVPLCNGEQLQAVQPQLNSDKGVLQLLKLAGHHPPCSGCSLTCIALSFSSSRSPSMLASLVITCSSSSRAVAELCEWMEASTPHTHTCSRLPGLPGSHRTGTWR